MELRPGLKQSDVGVIPEDWIVFELDDACERITVGLAMSVTKHYRPSGVPIIRNLNIKEGFFDGQNMLYVSQEFAKVNATKSAKAFDVLTVRTGANLGDTCVLPSAFDSCQTFTTLIASPKRSLLNPHFLCLHMTSFIGKTEISRLRVGGGKGNLNTGNLKRYRISVPQLSEQEAIVEALRDADALIESLEQLIAKKRDLKQGSMAVLLSGKKRLPGFIGEWEIGKLGDVAEMGSGGTPSSTNPAFYDGDIPWVSISDMTKCGKVITTTERNLTSLGLANSAAQLFPAQTVLYAMYASLGECSIAGVPLSSSQAILGIRAKPALDNVFLYYFLTSIKPVVRTIGQQGTQSNLNKGMVQRFQLRIPSLPEQTAIAAILTAMDAEISSLEARLTKARQIKEGMMQELLTGKTRLL